MNVHFWSHLWSTVEPAVAVVVQFVCFTVAIVFWPVLFVFVFASSSDERAKRRQRWNLEKDRERSDFYKRRWNKEEAALELKKYKREVERLEMGHSLSKRHFGHLSQEEIHQRVDFMEAGNFQRERKRHESKSSNLSDADRRKAHELWCERQRKKELDALMGEDRLTHTAQSQLQYQRLKRLDNYWEDKKFKGPSKDWVAK